MDVRRWIPSSILITLFLIPTISTDAQEQLWVGPNVNMVSGTTWPDGDPFLQRQNEPSVAVSTRRPLTIMAASNDYRTVDLPGLPDGMPIADSWIGVYTSFNGGGSWKSTLIPGYPQDQTAEGLASPIHGLQAAADPVMRAGTHGLFYLNGIAFDRGATPQSKLFVARYVDLNNDPLDPVQYIDTVEVASYTFPSNVFIDKPWMAVDAPRDGATCGNVYLAWAEIESSGDTVIESRIMFSTSTDCGATWDMPHLISDPGTVNQGASVAVSPDTGDVFVAWRQLTSLSLVPTDCFHDSGYWKTHPDEWPVESIAMGGVTYSKEEALGILNTPARGAANVILAYQLIPAKLNFEINNVSTEIQAVIDAADAWLMANPFGTKPKGAAKDEGLAINDQLEAFNNDDGLDGLLGLDSCGIQVPNTSNAIIAIGSINGGSSFGPLVEVSEVNPFDQGTSAYSFRSTAYPTMTVDESGRIYLAWSTRGLADGNADSSSVSGDARIVVSTSTDGVNWSIPQPIDRSGEPGHQIQPSITIANDQILLVYNDFRLDKSGVFDRFVVDWLTPEHPFRHTVDVRAAVAEPGPSPVFTDYSLLPEPNPSTQLSKYFCIPTIQGGFFVFMPLEYNPPNLPMFKAGTVPFFGDYVDIAAAPAFIPDGNGGWTHNTGPSTAPVAHAVWTDNRDVVGPPEGYDWTDFVPPGNGGTSVFDGATPVPACDPDSDDIDLTRMRNQNIYTSRLTTGLHVAVPGIWRPLTDAFQRAFVVFVENGTDASKAFRLEILDQPPNGQASFDQFEFAVFADVVIEPYSSASRTVYVSSSDARTSIEVSVTEIDGFGGNLVPGGLQSSALINPDPSNPYPADASLMTGETHAPAVFNPAVYNPAVYNPAVFNPAVFNPAVFNPAVFNPAVFNDAVLNYAVTNPAVFNPAVLNPAVFNPAVFNPAVFNQAIVTMSLLNPAVFNPAVFNPAVLNPAVFNPAVFNPAVFNPAVLNPAVFNPAVFNPAVFNPAVLNPAVFNTALDDSSALDLNLIAKNEGNTTSAYSLNLAMLDEPEGFSYQLMVYRLYFTPVVNGCELTEAAQQELLVHSLDPDLGADLLDPAGDVSFFLSPDDYAVITLRITPDPLNPGDPTTFPLEDISAAVVAQAVDNDDVAAGKTQSDYDTFGSSVLEITTTQLPGGNQLAAYTRALLATGGSGAYTWSLAAGSGPLPDGLGLGPAGTITGTPTTVGTSSFTAEVTDGAQSAQQELSISIAAAGGGPVFLVQPTSGTSGEALTPFSVIVLDGTGVPIPGLTVDLSIASTGCAGANLSPPVVINVTGLDGIANFWLASIDRGGTGYTLAATTVIFATPLTAVSNPFDMVGSCGSGTLTTPRDDHTATLLTDGTVLVAGGTDDVGGQLATAETYDPVGGAFALTAGGMVSARTRHTATLLPSGQVLLTGGYTGSTVTSSAELYNPGSGTFSATGSMGTARQRHTATLLPSGLVLIVGGLDDLNNEVAGAELYDPATGTFTPTTGGLAEARMDHTATLLADDRVFVAGGTILGGGTIFTSAEIYDPTTDTFNLSLSMGTPRTSHAAALLTDGTVLIAGGFTPTATASAEIFDPFAETIDPTGGMATARTRFTATLLDTGQAAVLGGSSGAGVLSSAEVFDPYTGAFGPAGYLVAARQSHTATLLDLGYVLVVGGSGVTGVEDTTELFFPESGSTLTVTTTANDGPGSLRTAILAANIDADLDTITFGIPGPGPHTIAPLSALPIITRPVVIDGTTQPGYAGSPVIELDGTAAGGTSGLQISAGSSTVQGLAINGFSGTGLLLYSRGNNKILGNHIGTDLTGTVALFNQTNGIFVFRSCCNTIGGATPAHRNVIAGNTFWGIRLDRSDGNSIQGNWIGTNPSYSAGLGNGERGISNWFSNSTLIGGSHPSAGNVSVGNASSGIQVYGSSGAHVEGNHVAGNGGTGIIIDGGSHHTTVINNLIGTDSSGTQPAGNTLSGVFILDSWENRIGGPGGRNIISSNRRGIFIRGADNVVENNYIGTDITGTNDLGNDDDGIWFYDEGLDNYILNNLVSGNGRDGVSLSYGAVRNIIENNRIGITSGGATALPNDNNGVLIESFSSENTIAGNVISGNGADGIRVYDLADLNVLAGNTIGLNVAGNAAVPNQANGIHVDTDSDDNVIGGAAPGAGNVVAGNTGSGIVVESNSNQTIIQGNWIGTNPSYTAGLGNGDRGIQLLYASNTLIGGADPGARNVVMANTFTGTGIANSSSTLVEGNLISANGGSGIVIQESDDTKVFSNLIGTDQVGTLPQGNNRGLLITRDSTGVVVGGPTGRNIISGNVADGIWITSGYPNTGDFLIENNYIGTDISGFNAIPNQPSHPALYAGIRNEGDNCTMRGNLISGNAGGGIWMIEVSNNVLEDNRIGTTSDGSTALANGAVGAYIEGSSANNTIIDNLVSGNVGNGIRLYNGPSNNLIVGNTVGLNETHTAAVPNQIFGINIELNSPDNTIGGMIPGAGNVVAGNSSAGVRIVNGADRTIVQGNWIGTNSSMAAGLGNTGSGVYIYNSEDVEIGGTDPNAGNVVANNGSDGLYLMLCDSINVLWNLISGNGDSGIELFDSASTTIVGNLIGTEGDGSSPMANTGPGISIDGSNNIIGGTMSGAGNTIAFNSDGVVIAPDATNTGNIIVSNSMFSNSGLGIDLGGDGVTLNDPGDGDTGANDLLNFPIVASASESGGVTTIVVSIANLSPTTITRAFQLFASSLCDPSGYGEGETPIYTSVSYSISPSSTLNVPVSLTMALAGDYITATAVSPAPGINTSEFSACRLVTGP